MAISDKDFGELFHQVRLINSRVTGIEDTTEVILRADAGKIRDPFLKRVSSDPLLGRVYLAIDGKRSQRELARELKEGTKTVSEATVSRKIDQLREEHLVMLREQTKAGRIYQKHPVVERNLRLSRHVTRLLTKQSSTSASGSKGRNRRSSRQSK